MHRLLAVVVTLVLASSAAPLRAQQMLVPQPIDSAAPAALRARAVADLALAGDLARLRAYLEQHATPAYRDASSFAGDLTQVIEALQTGPRTIVRLDGLGDVGVGVALGASAGAAPERAVLVRVERDAPHRVAGVGVVGIGGD